MLLPVILKLNWYIDTIGNVKCLELSRPYSAPYMAPTGKPFARSHGFIK